MKLFCRDVTQLNAGGRIFPVRNATLVVLRLLQPSHPPSRLFPTNHIRGEDMRACGRLWSGPNPSPLVPRPFPQNGCLFLHLIYARARAYLCSRFGERVWLVRHSLRKYVRFGNGNAASRAPLVTWLSGNVRLGVHPSSFHFINFLLRARGQVIRYSNSPEARRCLTYIFSCHTFFQTPFAALPAFDVSLPFILEEGEGEPGPLPKPNPPAPMRGEQSRSYSSCVCPSMYQRVFFLM